MKKFSLSFALILVYGFVNAQDQFTNSGNFQTFPGASVTFFGNFANNGTFTDAQAITFNGTANQIISGTSITTFYDLVANSAIGVTLQQDVVISNSLALTSGQLNLNSRTLTINNIASTAVSRTSGYILSEQVNNSSKVKWNIGTAAGQHIFPFGTAIAEYIPFSLEVTAGDIGNVTVSTFPAAADNTPYPTLPSAVTNVDRMGSDNSVNVVDRFWQIDKDGPSGTTTIIFAAAPSEVGSIATLNAQRWNTSTSIWEDPLVGQTSSANGVTVVGVTSFSPWTLSGNNAPLPVEMVSFTATPMKRSVDLNWKTATETNNDYFTVQRSKSGLEFSEIGNVPAGNAGKTIQHYNYVDSDALPDRSYYRLKQTDFDGVYKYSDIRTVDMKKEAPKITVFPNPSSNNQFAIDFNESFEGSTLVTVCDVLGKIVFKEFVQRGVQVFNVNLSNARTGVYVVKTTNNEFSASQIVVLK